MSDYRDPSQNATASAIIAIRGEQGVLLDYIIKVVDYLEENLPTLRDERTSLDERLIFSGEKLRNLAINRKKEATTETKKHGKSFSSEYSDGDDEEKMVEHVRL